MFNFTKCLSARKLVFRSNECRRNLSSSLPLHVKIALCGASGGVGQPLSLLLKMSPLVSELVIYDIAHVNGVAADLSHINTKVKITAYDDPTCLEDAVTNKDIVVVAAGKPRQPGMSKDDIFDVNAQIIKEISVAVSRMAPKALFAIITNPVNSVVPIAAEVFKKANVFDARKIFGVTTLDVVRASTFSAKILCLDPTKVTVPVIGGHTGIAVVPLLSQAKPTIELPKDKLKALSERIQNAGSEIITIKAGKGSATLSTAYAAARFIFALCRGIRGENDIVECAYVASDLTDATYFATPLLLGPEGIKKNLGFGKLDNFECNLLNAALPEIIRDIKKGVDFIKSC